MRSPHRGAWNFIFRTILYGFRISCTVLLLCCLFLCVSDRSCLFSRLRGPFSKMFVLSQNKTKFCSPYACFTVTTGCNSYNRLQQALNRSKHGCSFLVIVTNHWPVCGLNIRPKKRKKKCRKLLHCWAYWTAEVTGELSFDHINAWGGNVNSWERTYGVLLC